MYIKDMPSVAVAASHNEGLDTSRDGQIDEDLVLDGVVIDDRIAAAYAIVELGEREKKVAEFPSSELDEDLELDDLDQYHQVPRSPEYCRKDRRRKYDHRSSADSSPVRTPQKHQIETHPPRLGHVRGAVMPSRTSGKPVPKLGPKRRLEDEENAGGIKAKLARMLFEKKISRTDSSEKSLEEDEKETGTRCKGVVDSDEEQQIETQGGRFVRTSMPRLQPINVISCAQSGARFEQQTDNHESLQIRLEQSLSAEEISRLRESLLRKGTEEAKAKEASPLNVSTPSSRVSPNHAYRSPSTSPPTTVGWREAETSAEDLVIPASSSRSQNTPKVELALSTKDTEDKNLSRFLPQNEMTDYSIREDASRVNIPPSWPIMPPFLFLGSASEAARNSTGNCSEGCEPMVVKTLVPGTGLVQYLVLPTTKPTPNQENSLSCDDRRDLKVNELTETRQHFDDALTKLKKFSLGKQSYGGSPSRSELISSDAGVPYWCPAPQARGFYPQFGSLNSISNYYSVANSPALSETGLYPSNSAVSRSCHDLTRIPSESPKFPGVPAGLPRLPSPNSNIRYERPKSNESVQRSRTSRVQRVHRSRRKISPVAYALEMVRGGEFGSLRTLRKFYSSLKPRNTLNLSEQLLKKTQLDKLRERTGSLPQNYEEDAQDFPLDLSSYRRKFSNEQRVEVKRSPSEPQSFSDCKIAVPFKTNSDFSSLEQHDSISRSGSDEWCSDSLIQQQQKSHISDISGSRTAEVTAEKSANPSLAHHSLSSILPNSSLPPKKRKLRQPSQSCDLSESKTVTSTSTSTGSTLAYRLQADSKQTQQGASENLGAMKSEELDVNRRSIAVVSPAEIGFTLTPEMKLLENKVGVRDEDGDLPLHIAVAKGYLKFVQKVLLPMMSQHGVHIDSCNHQRQTALHLAVITNQPQMVETLLRASASATVCDRKGNTAVHLAVKYKTPSCLQNILNSSRIQIDLDAKNYEGLTALHLGVQLGEREAVKALLANGADPNAMDGTNGRTPLFYAVETNDDIMASILLKHGSDPCIASYSGCTPLQIATAKSFRDMTNMLERSFPRGFETTARQEENFGSHV